MKEFGSKANDDIVYINFDSNSGMAELFASDLNTDRLLMGIELYDRPAPAYTAGRQRFVCGI